MPRVTPITNEPTSEIAAILRVLTQALLEHVADDVAGPVGEVHLNASGSARCPSRSRIAADIVQTMIR